jgi:hypothetical protein
MSHTAVVVVLLGPFGSTLFLIRTSFVKRFGHPRTVDRIQGTNSTKHGSPFHNAASILHE